MKRPASKIAQISIPILIEVVAVSLFIGCAALWVVIYATRAPI